MSSPDCKRQKLADHVNSVAKMSKVSPTKNVETRTEAGTSQTSNSKKLISINVSAQKFEEIAKSDGFVDRTMLIEELLYGSMGTDSKYVMIFAPSKFGKTLNLDMIRLFCDIADKNTNTKQNVAKDPTMEDLRLNPSNNMNVFLRQFEGTEHEECLIMKQEQLVIQHFGRHPVVVLDFQECVPENKSDAIVFCAQQVRNAYLENSYLENSEELQSRWPRCFIKTCTAWINYEIDDLERFSMLKVIDGLQNLIKSLRMHWGRKPVFLVDALDKPCVAAMELGRSEKEIREIGMTITNVLGSILKTSNEQLQLQAALVTGICKFLTSDADNVPVYFLSDHRFSEYYGLTPKEVHTLVEKLCGSEGDPEKTKKIISDINVRYKGYYQRDNEEARYCIFSVLNYIKNRDDEKFWFWTDGGLLVPMLFKYAVNMENMRTLCFDYFGTVEIDYADAIDVQHILGLYRGDTKPNLDALFNFLLQRGYLTHNPEKPTVKWSTKINVKIPNREVKQNFDKLFLQYYKQNIS